MAALDKHYMQLALRLARDAFGHQEVPVGAVLVVEGKICGWGSNRRMDGNVLGHAELIALQTATEALGNWRLLRSTLYVPLEPCIMCTGAIVQSHIRHVYYGSEDPKGGGLVSVINIKEVKGLNHYPEITGGILRDKCSSIVKEYFSNKRKK